MDPRQDGLRELCLEHDIGTAQRLDQDCLDGNAHLAAVAFARQVYEAGEETAEWVRHDEQAGTLAFLQTEHAQGGRQQVVDPDLEQGIAREIVQYVCDDTTGVAVRRQLGARKYRLDLPPQQRDLARRHAVCAGSKQTDQAMQPDDHTLPIAPFDRYTIQVCRPMDARACIGLGNQQIETEARQIDPDARHPALGAFARLRTTTQHAQPRTLDEMQRCTVHPIQFELAGRDKQEMIVDHPIEKGARLGSIRAAVVRRAACTKFLLDLLRQQLHLQPVRGRHRYVADDASHQLLQFWQGLMRLALDVQLDDGLERTEFDGRLGFLQRLQPSVAVTRDSKHGVDGELDRKPALIQRRRDGIHQKRHILRNHLDNRVATAPAMLLLIRVVDADLRLTRTPLAHQPPVCDQRTDQILWVVFLEIRWRDMTIVGIQQLLDLRSVEPAGTVGWIGRQQLAQFRDQPVTLMFRHLALKCMSLPLTTQVVRHMECIGFLWYR